MRRRTTPATTTWFGPGQLRKRAVPGSLGDDLDTGARLLNFLAGAQDLDGSWVRCLFLDGSALPGLQLDEVALRVLVAAELTESGGALPASAPEMVRRAVRYLVRCGPAGGEDRWEEAQGTSP